MSKNFLVSVAVLSVCSVGFSTGLNTGGNHGLLRTTSAQTLGKARLNVGAGIGYGQDVDFVNGFNSPLIFRTKDSVFLNSKYTNRLISTNLYAGIGAGKTTDFAISIPYYYDMAEWGVQEGGIGDLEVSIKVNPFAQDKLFALAMELTTIVPTGDKDQGYCARHGYSFSDKLTSPIEYSLTGGAVLVEPKLAITGNFKRVKIHGNIGDVINIEEKRSTITTAAGIEFLATERFNIFTEVSGETRSGWFTEEFDLKNINNDVAYWSTGSRFAFKNGIYLLGAADIGISDDIYSKGANSANIYGQKGTPKWNANVQIGWNGQLKPRDTDLDSIPDKLDNCVTQPEDYDGFKDSDGCPEVDNDNDGIADANDKSPLEPEDKDGFEDEDGAPELDNDGDLILDLSDKCPNVSEDMDGFEDTDGCPELDNDTDGIVDSLDKCPNVAEDKDGFQDENGCPEKDNDEDGIPDLDDQCPNAIGLPENNGCPVVKEISREGLVLRGVNFELGKSVLTESSSQTLEEVAASLIAWIEVKVEIQGHTDSTGSAAKNLSMSQERAEAVKTYLYNKGVSADRMVAKGYGKEVPVADNKTKEGRALNRRVELKRID